MKEFKFIDLFAGIGGFHQAMASLGGQCILASEIDKAAVAVYKANYGVDSSINVRSINENSIPDFDVLCGGFPCQAFSKAGARLGLQDRTRGTLFFDIVRILKAKKPKWFILENVKNIVTHDNGNTWRIIQESIRELGYRTTSSPLILSPHQFGIPQIRERVIIPGMLDPENVIFPIDISFSSLLKKEDNSIYSILDENETECGISEYEEGLLSVWEEFYQGINLKTIGFPVWTDSLTASPVLDGLPEWKASVVSRNSVLYRTNKPFIDSWLKKHDRLKKYRPTHRKFEWQCGTKISTIWEGVIQMRPSGVRVKSPDCFQTLVAMVQVPIIGRYRRRLTVREAARLQCFPVDSSSPFVPDANPQRAYRQFGNAVNVEVIRQVAKRLFECSSEQPKQKSGVFAFC